MVVDTDEEEKESRRKYMSIFPTLGGEATNLEKMEYLYASVWSQGMEEEYGVPFPECKVVPCLLQIIIS